jgi:hypothetical protein
MFVLYEVKFSAYLNVKSEPAGMIKLLDVTVGVAGRCITRKKAHEFGW